MAGKYGSQSWTVQYDDGPGGTLRTITNHVLTISGVKIESMMQLTHALGDSAEESTPTGMIKFAPITVEGFWDTTATTGPHAVFQAPDDGPQDDTRTLTVSPGDSKTLTVETRLVSYEVLAERGNLTKFRAVIQPTGTGAWA